MGNTIYSGISQLPGDFDKSRLAPEVRAGLKDQSPEIAAGIRRVAAQPATPDKPKGK
jgi:hypothetical protein